MAKNQKNNKGQEFAEAMKRMVPQYDHPTVKYALACAALHFGIYSPKTYIGDIVRSMFGGSSIGAREAREKNL